MMHEPPSSHSGMSSLPGRALRTVVVDSPSLVVGGAVADDGVGIGVGVTSEETHAETPSAIATVRSNHRLIRDTMLSNHSRFQLRVHGVRPPPDLRVCLPRTHLSVFRSTSAGQLGGPASAFNMCRYGAVSNMSVSVREQGDLRGFGVLRSSLA
jgi:hypothetical protein